MRKEVDRVKIRKNTRSCGICGKLGFPSEEFAGYDDWYECGNPNCPGFEVKWRVFE